MTNESNRKPILELQNIYKVFDHDILKKKEIIINGLSVVFNEGKCSGFLGHNGSGKTTTIRLILGLIRPNRGKVLYKGSLITQEAKRSIGFMPEVNKLSANLTPIEVLQHQLNVFNPPSIPKSQRAARIEEELRSAGIWDFRNRRIRKLSKGMARRVAWAQAIITDPELLILDEPTSGLDPLGRIEMNQWISKIKNKGTSIVLCTHELSTAHDLCDDINVIRKGQLVYSTVLGIREESDKSRIASSHYLEVSGADRQTFEQLKNVQKLPQWTDFEQNGYLCRLGFLENEIAQKWLHACIDKGLVVVKFGDYLPPRFQDLLPYFQGGH